MTITAPGPAGLNVVNQLPSAYLGARALHIVAKLGVADALRDEPDAEPATTETLATASVPTRTPCTDSYV
jgi:hypothetical protein